MTYGGLRGAVAFYLALRLEGPLKNQIVTMTIVLILFTVVGMGSTTMPFLNLVNKWFPQDKIIDDPKNDEQLSLLDHLDR